jgi:hypothetical protein
VAGAALATAAHSAPVTEPGGDDAELLALCHQFMAEGAVIDAWNAGAVTEGLGEAANDRWWVCMRAMVDTPALAGWARVLPVHNRNRRSATSPLAGERLPLAEGAMRECLVGRNLCNKCTGFRRPARA